MRLPQKVVPRPELEQRAQVRMRRLKPQRVGALATANRPRWRARLREGWWVKSRVGKWRLKPHRAGMWRLKPQRAQRLQIRRLGRDEAPEGAKGR